MFLHHSMTDREVLRSCEGCESPHLRLVADRLRVRLDNLLEIQTLCAMAQRTGNEFAALNTIKDISNEGQ